jgi:hypothetical protein
MPADRQQIAKQFATILLRADPKITDFYSNTTGARFGTDRPEDIDTNPETSWLGNEQVQLLGKLYQALDRDGREFLVQFALGEFTPSRHWPDTLGYVFTFLAKFHDFDSAFDAMVGSFAMDERGWYLMTCFSNFIKHDHWILTDTQLTSIFSKLISRRAALKDNRYDRTSSGPYTPTQDEVAYQRVRNRIAKILEQVEAVKYSRLKESLLRDVNLEVNQDRESLVQALNRFGFPKGLVQSLEHAENEYRKAESEFDFKTSADHSRSFFETLLWEVATKIAILRKEEVLLQRKNAVEVREYLKNSGFLSERLRKLCEAFYQFASDESTHQLMSGREVARIVRNMNVELALLLMKRLQGFLGS